MKFSQRMGFSQIRDVLQVENIDKDLENLLWNNILEDFLRPLGSDHDHIMSNFCKVLWTQFFKLRIDEIPSYNNGDISSFGVKEYLKKWYFKAQWYEKYDLIEFLADVAIIIKMNFVFKVNITLKSELAGYRLIENKIVPITSEQELEAIEEALKTNTKYAPVITHLSRSLELLSNRKDPNYRNSVKESISAVESYCSILTSNPKETLGSALAKIEKSHKIHNALKSAFKTLYGYTSDSGGIRHSLIDGDIPVTLEDAKFMLISCSAFINYLKAKE